MRKLAPAFILTSLVALASGSALAMGYMHKKKSTSDTTTQPSGSASSTMGSPSQSSSGPNSTSSAGTTFGSTGGGAGDGSGSANSTGPGTRNSTSSSMGDASSSSMDSSPKASKSQKGDCATLKPTDAQWTANHCAGSGATSNSR